jgi:hypothetical protein
MTGDDSTVPAPTPASPHPRQYPLDYRGENVPRPRQHRVPDPRRGLHGDPDADVEVGDEQMQMQAGRCGGRHRRADAAGRADAYDCGDGILLALVTAGSLTL